MSLQKLRRATKHWAAWRALVSEAPSGTPAVAPVARHGDLVIHSDGSAVLEA